MNLSVFFPALNEEKNIEATVSRAISAIEPLVKKLEVIVVNDGSTDKTKEVVEKFAKRDKRVRLINHEENKGYGGALKSGFYGAKYEWIFFSDGDGQFDFGEFKKLSDEVDEADLVIGFRKNRAEGFLRVANAKLWSLFILVLFGLRVKDIDCAFKLVKKKVLDTIPKLESDGAMVSAELLVKAKKAGFTIKEVPVSHFLRVTGNPTGANIKVILRAFKEALKLRFSL